MNEWMGAGNLRRRSRRDGGLHRAAGAWGDDCLVSLYYDDRHGCFNEGPVVIAGDAADTVGDAADTFGDAANTVRALRRCCEYRRCLGADVGALSAPKMDKTHASVAVAVARLACTRLARAMPAPSYLPTRDGLPACPPACPPAHLPVALLQVRHSRSFALDTITFTTG